jgi:D-alanine-D-alanine ligase
MKTRVGVIFGGRSGEHEISIRSANTVIKEIDKEKYDVVPLAITREGKWLTPGESIALLPAEIGSLAEEGVAGVSENAAMVTGSLIEGNNGAGLDVAFPVLHGTYGEDGTIQGLLEMANIPYVGGGVLASSCGMDKVVMKALFRDSDLPICKYVWFLRSEWERGNDVVIRQVESKLGYPCFVKPANLGSSVGVTRADDAESLKSAIDLAAEYDRKIIVEEALDMREIECAVMGNDEPEASLPGEYLIRDDAKKFLDYTEKYAGTGNNEFVVPAPISSELTEKIRKMAVAAYKAVDGSGLARVDFFLRNDNGMLLVNEINTMPGLTDASGFPKMWAGTGVPFTAVIDRLITYAIERHGDRARNKTSF